MFLFYAIEHFYKEMCRICAKTFKICEIFVKKASFDLEMPQNIQYRLDLNSWLITTIKHVSRYLNTQTKRQTIQIIMITVYFTEAN